MRSPDTIPVDIVISNYNYATYLDEAIQSARDQDHPNVKVIVVDDGSTDASREKLRAYEGLIEVVLQDNAGQSSALNAGFSRCRGEVVMFLDSDDVLTPTAASRAAAAFAADPRAARVQFRMALIDGERKPLGMTKPPPHRPMPSGDLRHAELSFPFDLTWVAMSGNAYRTALLRKIMPIPYDEYGQWGSDWYLVHLTNLLGSVVTFEELGAFYRVHGQNAIEPGSPRLSLGRLRWEITYQQKTIDSLMRLADELGIERPARILSLSNLGNRIISHKLDPAGHPVAGDRTSTLMADVIRAAPRRYDISVLMRVLLVVLLCMIAISPRPVARKLAELFVFPERRPWWTRLVGRMHRKPAVVAQPSPQS
jgi:glycosyltransferase involved in cell wall biosynthesis